MEKVYYAFYTLLEEYKKLDILSIDLDSPYLKYIGRNNTLNESDLNYEILVEDM